MMNNFKDTLPVNCRNTSNIEIIPMFYPHDSISSEELTTLSKCIPEDPNYAFRLDKKPQKLEKIDQSCLQHLKQAKLSTRRRSHTSPILSINKKLSRLSTPPGFKTLSGRKLRRFSQIKPVSANIDARGNKSDDVPSSSAVVSRNKAPYYKNIHRKNDDETLDILNVLFSNELHRSPLHTKNSNRNVTPRVVNKASDGANKEENAFIIFDQSEGQTPEPLPLSRTLNLLQKKSHSSLSDQSGMYIVDTEDLSIQIMEDGLLQAKLNYRLDNSKANINFVDSSSLSFNIETNNSKKPEQFTNVASSKYQLYNDVAQEIVGNIYDTRSKTVHNTRSNHQVSPWTSTSIDAEDISSCLIEQFYQSVDVQ